jgi:hypothetical protein
MFMHAFQKYLALDPRVARRLLQVRRDARPLPQSESERRAALIAKLDAALSGMRRLTVVSA